MHRGGGGSDVPSRIVWWWQLFTPRAGVFVATHEYSGVWNAACRITKEEGTFALFKGVRASMARCMVGTGSQLTSYSYGMDWCDTQVGVVAVIGAGRGLTWAVVPRGVDDSGHHGSQS